MVNEINWDKSYIFHLGISKAEQEYPELFTKIMDDVRFGKSKGEIYEDVHILLTVIYANYQQIHDSWLSLTDEQKDELFDKYYTVDMLNYWNQIKDLMKSHNIHLEEDKSVIEKVLEWLDRTLNRKL
jgi:hypothetical protein